MSLAAEVVPCGNEGTGEAVHEFWPLSQILRFGAENLGLFGFGLFSLVLYRLGERVRAGCFTHVGFAVIRVARVLAFACWPWAYGRAEAGAVRSARVLFASVHLALQFVSLLYDVW